MWKNEYHISYNTLRAKIKITEYAICLMHKISSMIFYFKYIGETMEHEKFMSRDIVLSKTWVCKISLMMRKVLKALISISIPAALDLWFNQNY